MKRLRSTAGQSLVEILIGASILIFIAVLAGNVMVNTSKNLKLIDVMSQRDYLYGHYSELLRNQKYISASITSQTANPTIFAFLKNPTPGQSGDFTLLSPQGTTIIPPSASGGLYLDMRGAPANSTNYFWNIYVTWSATTGGSYKTQLFMKRNPSSTVNGASLAGRTKSTYDRSLLECFKVTGSPTTEVYNAHNDFYGYGGNLPGVARPPDSNLTMVSVSCPPPTVMVSVSSSGACGGTSFSSAITGVNTGQCQGFEATPSASGCNATQVRMSCLALCCKFPFVKN